MFKTDKCVYNFLCLVHYNRPVKNVPNKILNIPLDSISLPTSMLSRQSPRQCSLHYWGRYTNWIPAFVRSNAFPVQNSVLQLRTFGPAPSERSGWIIFPVDTHLPSSFSRSLKLSPPAQKQSLHQNINFQPIIRQSVWATLYQQQLA